jgi:DNA-binding NtrC family response regulator
MKNKLLPPGKRTHPIERENQNRRGSDMEDPWKVAVVSSSLDKRQDVAEILFRLGIDAICVSTVDEFRGIPGREDFGLVFCDRQMKDGDYRDVLPAAASTPHNPRVVMMSEFHNPEDYQRAKRLGLFDVIPSPCRSSDIEWMIIQARRASRKELLRSSPELPILHKTARTGS